MYQENFLKLIHHKIFIPWINFRILQEEFTTNHNLALIYFAYIFMHDILKILKIILKRWKLTNDGIIPPMAWQDI